MGMSKNKADQGRKQKSKAGKIALGMLGVGVAAGAAIVVGVDQVMKRIFVNDEWPDEEWSSDNWADEDLES